MTKDNKKTIARIVALSLLASATAYEINETKNNLKIKEPLKKVVDEFDANTKLDEVASKNIATYKNTNIIEATDYLEESIEIVELLKDYDFTEVKGLEKLKKEEYSFANALTREDVVVLLEIINSDNDSLEFTETKLKSIKMLDYIKHQREKYINNNGREIILNLLSWSVKSSIGEELGLKEEKVKDIEIPPLKKIQDMKFYTIYNDEKYFVSSKADVFGALYYYYQIKSTKDLKDQQIIVFKEALNSAKVLTMTGINIENHILTNENSLKEARKILKNG